VALLLVVVEATRIVFSTSGDRSVGVRDRVTGVTVPTRSTVPIVPDGK
jgi:hypothetical protein